MKGRKLLVTGVAILFLALPAYADVMTVPFSGSIDYVADPAGHFNAIGINSSTTLMGSATFDTNYTGSGGQHYILTDPSGLFNITVGSLGYNQNDASGSDFCRLFFDGNVDLIGIDFATGYVSGGNYAFKFQVDRNRTEFEIFEENKPGSYVQGTFDFTSIPIPGAVWLMGSGLVCLVGLRRRFRKAQ